MPVLPSVPSSAINTSPSLASTEKSALKYRPDIDGLRAIAVIAVVIFHAFPKTIRGGFIGVDIFFVISGFLISSIIFVNLDNNKFSFIDFYKRRIRRIFPALIFVLSVCLAFGWFVLLNYEYRQLGKHIAAGAGFISNFVLWNEAGYFDQTAATKPLLHLWSLGIEEQFYILWPVLLWFVWKRKYNLLIIIISLAVISFFFSVYEIKNNPVATFYSPLTRFWELLSGSILAWVSFNKRDEIEKIRNKLSGWFQSLRKNTPQNDSTILINVISIFGVLFLIYGFWRIHRSLNFPGKWAVIPVLGAVLIICAGPAAWVNRKILSCKFLVWFGLISFPLYLWHWPIITFMNIIDDGYVSIAARIGAIILSVLLAWLTYQFIEKPVRFKGNSRVITIILILLMIIMGLSGYYTYLRNRSGIPNQEEFTDVIVKEYGCEKEIPESGSFCSLSKKGVPPTIAFIGDSHMLHYKNAIWNKFGEESLILIVRTSCFPFSSDYFMSRIDCRKSSEVVRNYLVNSQSIKTVVLSGYWAYLMSEGNMETGTELPIFKPKPLTETSKNSYMNNASVLFSALTRSGKRVILIKDNPDLDFNIKNCLDPRPFRISSNVRKECSINYQNYINRVVSYDSVNDEVLKKFLSVEVYDSAALFCSNGKCMAKGDRLPYYADDNHLNNYGADMVITDFKKKFDLSKN